MKETAQHVRNRRGPAAGRLQHSPVCSNIRSRPIPIRRTAKGCLTSSMHRLRTFPWCHRPIFRRRIFRMPSSLNGTCPDRGSSGSPPRWR
jgi:hypothetical protein